VQNTINNIINGIGATPTITTDTLTNAEINDIIAHMNVMASGTSYIPQDMPAYVHKGEMIVPRDFSSAISRGDLTLSGRGGSGGNNYTIIVEGSVTTERDLVTAISKGIDKQKKWGYA
jgi:hypothetical protein